jgi:signal transduction histidine kinase
MEPATPHKRKRHRNNDRTHQGRILLGEKGVGRFAADKLGAELILVTRSRSSDREIVLQISWNHFDADDAYLEDVKSTWQERKPVVFSGNQHGTLLSIRSLRTAWTQDMVSKLYNGLSRLVSPFAEKTGFVIEINSPEFPLIQGKVVNRLLETSPYHLSGHIDSEGRFFTDNQQEQPTNLCAHCNGHFLLPSGENRSPLCGPFSIALHVWDLDIQAGKGNGIDKARRDAIRSFCGVSMYRDGFRVWPYGERDDDWLELNQRRVNNPTLRVSNNQIIGFIEITHDNNPELKDRTSREGLIDTPAFFDLKALTLAILSLLEAERFNQRHQGTTSRKLVEAEQDELLGYLSKIDNSANGQTQGMPNTTKEIERLYRQKLTQEQDRYDRLSVLAGVGMAAELLTDALAREVNDTVTLLQILQGETQVAANDRIQHLLGMLTKKIQVIYEQIDLTAPLYHPQSNLHESVSAKQAIYDVLVALRQRLNDARVQVNLECETDLTVRTSRGHLMQAMMIIITNALESMSEAQISNSHIVIQVITGKNASAILLANNGPAIPPQYRKLIFEPSFSTRQTGRGLGLHVARDLLAICHCSLELLEDTSLLSGPCFRIRFDGRRIL